MRRRRSSSNKGSSDEFSSDYSTTSDESSSDESELRNLDERYNKRNPFTVPKIVVQPNSPIPGTSTPKQMLSPSNSGIPDAHHVAQTVPLGPTPFGTALYQPSLSSLMKYQYKTPTMTSSHQPTTQYRTLSGVLSNNLKKNWVTNAPQTGQTHRKVDQSEIDARLKSLMDRLSSQQSLLKPADKPSVQMQHYLDSTNKPQERKMSDTQPYVPYRPSMPPVVTTPSKDVPANDTTPTSDIKVEEDGISIKVPEIVMNNESDHDSDTIDSESDSSESESLTTEVDECENNVEHLLPEIKINLAEPEELSESVNTTPEKSDTKCDKDIGEDIEFIDNNVESPDDKSNSEEKSVDEESVSQRVASNKRNLPKRRPSLLKTVVSIKSDQPVTVVNYTETFDNGATNDKSNQENKSSEEKDNTTSPGIDNIQNASNEDLEESFKTTNGEMDSTKENIESFNTAMDSSISIADASMGGMESSRENMEVSTGTIECFNSELSNGSVKSNEKLAEMLESSDSNTESNQIQLPKDEPTENGLDNLEENSKKDECGNLLIVCKNAIPQQEGENETNTEATEENNQDENETTDIYKLKNANEKIERLGLHQQHQSNMIHDLIIGRTKQRRVRQPRVIATTSTVPVPPKESPPKPEHTLENLGDFQMIDDEDSSGFNNKADRNAREKSLSRSIRESSLSR